MDIKDIQHKLKTQDTCCTANPLFIVYEKTRIGGMSEEYTDKFYWIYDAEVFETSQELEKYFGGDIPEGEADKVFYIEGREFVSAHLTRKSAEEHIKMNNHKYEYGLFLYIDSMTRDSDIKDLRNSILNNEIYDDNKKIEDNDIRLARNAAANRGTVAPNDETIRAMLEAVVKGE